MNFLRRIFYGRYGGDRFNAFLCIVALVIYAVFWLAGVKFLLVVSLAIYLYALMRVFSKNIPQRQKEYRWYLCQRTKVTNFLRGGRVRVQDPTHAYFRCCKCGRTLRVPKGKGKIVIKCPCGNSLTKKT